MQKVDRSGQGKLINRRLFLRGAVISGAGLLAACTPNALVINEKPPRYATATPVREINRQGASPDATDEPVAEGSISLEEFLQFSSLLTGVENLDPDLGRMYLQALQSGEGSGPTLATVYGAASSGSGSMPQDLETLSSGGFFDQEGFGSMADQIITMWYTGVYSVDGEDVVATFVDALAWKVLTFTKPLTICASFGFWATEPPAVISPSIQYTPVPTEPEGENGGGE